jgi:hypothetical protein
MGFNSAFKGLIKTTTTTTANDVRWEIINVGLNTAVQILACSPPSAGH